jgi:3-phenylpropionate/cinnamic acid dioxygenase small subunit
MVDSAREVENLIYTYAERIDAGDLDGVGELFTHGRILSRPNAPPEETFVGREAVAALYRGAVRIHEDGTPRTRHVTTNVIVEVDDSAGTAHARSAYTVFQQTSELKLQPIVSGRYHDTFQRRDGRWWFDTRTMFIDLVGDMSCHLLIDIG